MEELFVRVCFYLKYRENEKVDRPRPNFWFSWNPNCLTTPEEHNIMFGDN